MKKNFRIFSVIFALAIMISAFVIPASALSAPILYGDLNVDNIIDVTDATALQRYIAKLDNRLPTYVESGDVDNDAELTIFDVTLIQQYVAKNITEFPTGEYYFVGSEYIDYVATDYDKDNALVGYPVTFSVNGDVNFGPARARLYINEELVCETQQYNKETHTYDLTYTFEKADAYRVRVALVNKWGSECNWTALYLVKDAPVDTTAPVITSITRDSEYNNRPIITTNVKLGTEPYQYKYTLTCDTYHGELVYQTDYIDSNVLNLDEKLSERIYLEPYNTYTIEVEVKDANGKIVKDNYTFRIEVSVPGLPSPF